MNWREEAQKAADQWRVKRDEAFRRHGVSAEAVEVTITVAIGNLPSDCIIPACYANAFQSVANWPKQPPVKSHHEAQPGVCRVCGCTQDKACPDGCSWTSISRTLCTTPNCTRIASVIDMIELCAQVADEAAKIHRPAHRRDMSTDHAWELVADKIDQVAGEIRELSTAFLEEC